MSRSNLKPTAALFPCIHNGITKALPRDEVHRLLHSLDIGIVPPLNRIRTRWRNGGECFRVPTSDRIGYRFGYYFLQKRRGIPFQRDEAADKLGKKDLSPNAFHGMARTYGRLLGVTRDPNSNGPDIRPYRHQEILVYSGNHEHAYVMNDDATWLIVLEPTPGMDSDSLLSMLDPLE